MLNRRTLEFLFAAGGIYVSYLYYGIVQNKLYLKQEDGTRFSGTAFVLFVQCFFNAVVAYLSGLLMMSTGSKKTLTPEQKLPFLSKLFNPKVMLVAFVYVFAMYTSNEALLYVSYSYQALAKACKLIPVMIGSFLITGKRYSKLKLFCMLTMTAAIVLFKTAGHEGEAKGASHSMENLGFLLLIISLVFDGAAGPGQEMIKKYMNNSEQALANNILATAYMGVTVLLTGQFQNQLAYLNKFPHLWYNLIEFSVCSGVGQIFIFYTIRNFDSLVLSTVTTTRKFFTIVVNVLWLPEENNLNFHQWLCVGIIFGAIGIDTFYSGGGHGHGHIPQLKSPKAKKKN